ncbi:MAG: hypothetical protein ABSC03_04910 [Verrucomicrobiota bacterium]|jgi:hypothetical protein
MSPDFADSFLPVFLRRLTLGAIGLILAVGIILLIPGAGLWFLVLGGGEAALYTVLKMKWRRAVRRVRQGPLQRCSWKRFVVTVWMYAMLMEFCVDFGAYHAANPLIVLAIMAVLTPHYLFMGMVFRLWFRWYTFTPTEAYLTMGTVGFLLEAIILKLIAGTWQARGMILYPLDFVVNLLNYGGFTVIATLYQNQTEERPRTKTWRKYLVGIFGTLGIALPEIVGTYLLVYKRL